MSNFGWLLAGILALSHVALCHATEINITVSRSPKIVDRAERLNHPEGTNATLTCSIGSGDLEGLTYEWLKDDTVVVGSSRYRIAIAPENYQSALRIIDLKPEDSATYSCVARNEFGMDKISIRLQVRVSLKWIAEPKGNLKASVGKPLLVPCSADGQPAPSVSWTKLQGAASQLRQFGTELRFNAIGQADAGLYECRARNGVEEDLVARVKIDVLVLILVLVRVGHVSGASVVNITASKSPKLIALADRINHSEDTNATFTCSIGSGDLNGLTFEWLKDDRRIPPSDKYKILIIPDNVNSILRVIDLKPEDSGTYSCVARNKFGQDRISTKLVVKVQLKWIQEPKGQFEMGVGKALALACAASGQPAPTIEWFKVEADSGSSRSLGSAFSIDSLSQEDAGLYECRARNGIDEDLVASIRLSVLGK